MTEQKPRISQIEEKFQLLVEGKDHKNFFEAFLTHLQRKNVQIHDFGGINNLKNFLPAFVTMPGFHKIVQKVGIVRDAEQSEENAFKSVRSSLRQAELPMPNRCGESSGHNPSITVLILPGGGRAGMLETLLCQSVANNPEKTCIDSFLQCVRELRGEDIKRPDKAHAHAYLATMDEPHVSVGVAADKKYWNLDHPVFDGIRQFLRKISDT